MKGEILSIFEIFKGRKGQKGRVKKIRSVGYAYYDELSNFCELEINGLEKPGYILEPEMDIYMPYDYVIYYESLKNEGLEMVGVGYLLNGCNKGLIYLEWDFYNTSGIYINLEQYPICEAIQKAA